MHSKAHLPKLKKYIRLVLHPLMLLHLHHNQKIILLFAHLPSLKKYGQLVLHLHHKKKNNDNLHSPSIPPQMEELISANTESDPSNLLRCKGSRSRVITFDAPIEPLDLGLSRKHKNNSMNVANFKGPFQKTLDRDAASSPSRHVNISPLMENETQEGETMEESENLAPLDLGSIPEWRKRGPNRNSKLEKLVRGHYDPAHPKKKFKPTIIISEGETRPVGAHSAGYAREHEDLADLLQSVALECLYFGLEQTACCLKHYQSHRKDLYSLEEQMPCTLQKTWRREKWQGNPTRYFQGNKKKMIDCGCETTYLTMKSGRYKLLSNNKANKAAVKYGHKLRSKSFPQKRYEMIEMERKKNEPEPENG